MFEQIIETLGLNPEDYSQWANKNEKFLMHQVRRKIRYACFAMQRGDTEDIPQKFKDYYEGQEHFSGWELFADRWDVEKVDPLVTYPRKFSIHEEWDAELRMAVPELAGAKSYKKAD